MPRSAREHKNDTPACPAYRALLSARYPTPIGELLASISPTDRPTRSGSPEHGGDRRDTPEKRAGAPDPRSSGAVKKDGKLRVSARCSGSSARTDRCEGIRQRQFPVLMTLACKPVAFVYVEAMGWR